MQMLVVRLAADLSAVSVEVGQYAALRTIVLAAKVLV